MSAVTVHSLQHDIHILKHTGVMTILRGGDAVKNMDKTKLKRLTDVTGRMFLMLRGYEPFIVNFTPVYAAQELEEINLLFDGDMDFFPEIPDLDDLIMTATDEDVKQYLFLYREMSLQSRRVIVLLRAATLMQVSPQEIRKQVAAVRNAVVELTQMRMSNYFDTHPEEAHEHHLELRDWTGADLSPLHEED